MSEDYNKKYKYLYYKYKTKYTSLKEQSGGLITIQDYSTNPALIKLRDDITKIESITCLIDKIEDCKELTSRSSCDYVKTIKNLKDLEDILGMSARKKNHEDMTRALALIGKDDKGKPNELYIPNELNIRDNVIRIANLYMKDPTKAHTMCK